VPLDRVVPGSPLRTGGLDRAHIQALSEIVDSLPPILLMPGSMVIVDGHHRYEAARLAGETAIRATFFEGDESAGFLESLRRNTLHGLPLSLRDRELAADRILEWHPEWSDRRIAQQCALSPTTVARLRPAHRPPPGAAVEKRVGIDGRARPVDRTAARQRMIAAINADPSASLRTIAARVGTSPETVRRVKASMQGRNTTAPARRSRGDDGAIDLPSFPRVTVAPWEPDQAMLTADGGSSLCEFLSKSALASDWHPYLDMVPRSRVYEVADEARRRAQYWAAFAQALEQRSRLNATHP